MKMKRRFNGSLTLLAQLKEVKYQPIKKNPKTKSTRSRTIEFDDRWELLWDPKKKILYGVKRKNFNKLKNVDLSGIIKHPSYEMVKIFKDQNVSDAFELEVNKQKAFQKLGKGVHVVYKSDKWNPKKFYEYIHEFGEDGYVVYKNHRVNIYYDPINQVYKMYGGKLNVDERGIIF